MNAIASSVNKGALKVAPKAGTARRSRQSSAAPKAPLLEPASKGISARATKSIPASDDEWNKKSTNEARTANRSVPVVTSTNISSDKLKKLATEFSTPHEVSQTTVDYEVPTVTQDSSDHRAIRVADPANEETSGNISKIRRPQRSAAVRASPPTEVLGHETIVPLPSGLLTSGDHSQTEELTSSERQDETPLTLMNQDETPLTLMNQDEIEGQSGSRKRKRTTGSSRARHVKREATPEEAEHELIDTTGLKMIDLCKDMRKGRKSSKHSEFVRIAAQRRRLHRNGRAASQSGRPETSELMPEGVDGESGISNSKTAEDENENGAEDRDTGPIADLVESHNHPGESVENPDDETSDHEHGVVESLNSAPQVRIVNGQIVLDVNSLQVDRALRDARADGGSIEYVEENPLEKIVNSRSYSKHKLSSRWDVASTELFYEGLSQWGTDFDMISRMFPSRDRKQIKNKFTVEERRNPSLVTQALIQKKPVDMDEYSKMSATIFRPITELEEELAGLRSKFESEREEAMKEVAQRKLEVADTQPQNSIDESKKKSRRRRADDGLELVGTIEEVEEAARQLAAQSSEEDAP